MGEADSQKFLLDGLSVVLPPHAAYLLDRHLLRPVLARTRRGDLAPELQELVRAIEQESWHYASERIAASRSAAGGTRGMPAPSTPPTLADEMTTSAAAQLLGCTARNVRSLATRKTLRGRRMAGRWFFERAEVEALVARRTDR